MSLRQKICSFLQNEWYEEATAENKVEIYKQKHFSERNVYHSGNCYVIAMSAETRESDYE